MPTADEMRNMGESILTAQRNRAVVIAGLKGEVDAMLSEYYAARRTMARETQEQLAQATATMKTDTAAFVGELAAGTAARKADVAGQLAEIDAAHQAMSRETRERLAQEKATMKADTLAFTVQVGQITTTRQAEVASQLAGYAIEMSQAREARREHLGAPPPPRPPKVKAAPRPSKVEAAPRPPKVEAAPRPPKVEAAPRPPKVEAAPLPPKVEAAPPSPPPVKEVTPDDLALIRGIGASMAARLNRMHITTYTQLAEASPDMIREKLGDFGRMAKVEDWIARAKELI